MRTVVYPCKYPEARKIGQDVSVVYKDDLLDVFTSKPRELWTAITAYHGDTIMITVMERMIVCSIKSAASELKLQDGKTR